MPRRSPPVINNRMMQDMQNNPMPPPNNQTEREPTLGELIATVQQMADNGDKRAENALKLIGDSDGTTTDIENGEFLKAVASEFQPGEIATTNMSDGAKHTEAEIIKQINLNNEEIEAMRNPNIFRMIIMWIKEKLFDFNVKNEIRKKEIENMQLIKEGESSVKDGKITIDENASMQIGSILKDKHFTAFIIDNNEKAVILIGPNGHILTENENYKDVNSKQEMLTKLFGTKKAIELMANGWKLCDANCYIGNDEEYKRRTAQIFDAVAYSDEQKNLENVQSKNGACGIICNKFIQEYIDEKFKFCQQSNQNIGNKMNKFLTYINNQKCTFSKEQDVCIQRLKNVIKIGRLNSLDTINRQNSMYRT